MTRAEAQISLAKLKQYMSGGGVVDRKANEALDMAIKALRHPERKTGKWIYNSPVTMKCDQCEYVIRDWFVNQFRFCPNCGSFNGGEEE